MGIETILHILVRGPLPSSLDDLVESLQQAWTEVGLPGFLALLLQALDASLIAQWRQGGLTPPMCCDDPVYEVRDWQDKRLRTSLGRVEFRWRRLCCRHCHHSWVPLREALHLQPHQQASRELEQKVVQQSTEQSYRKVAAGLPQQVGPAAAVGKSTACSWVHKQQATLIPVEEAAPPPAASPPEPMGSPADDAEADEEPASPGMPTRVPILLADGTNFHERAPADQPGQTHGEVRVVLGMTARGQVIPVGAWSGRSWQQIGHDVRGRLQRVVCLVSDGETGLQEGLAGVAPAAQRCHWHLQHDLATQVMERSRATPTRSGVAAPAGADPGGQAASRLASRRDTARTGVVAAGHGAGGSPFGALHPLSGAAWVAACGHLLAERLAAGLYVCAVLPRHGPAGTADE